jgi:iron complex transport system substrate-binding protein
MRTAMITRRRAFALSALAVASPSLVRAQEEIRVKDYLGREIRLARPARRIVLAMGRHLAVLNLLHPEPVSLVAGWADDMLIGAVSESRAYLRRFPQTARIPVLGRSAGGLHLEPVLALEPDLVVMSGGAGARAGVMTSLPLVRGLEAAGIPVAAIDFFYDPLANTVSSLRTLGRLIGREEQAAALIALHESAIARIRAAITETPVPRPTVMIHAHAGGTPCCDSPGRGTFDGFIRLAGGHNIGADVLSGATGTLSLEHLLTVDPNVYVATGGSFNGRGGVMLGAGVGEAKARASLQQVISGQKLDALTAVKTGRAHGIWHGCNDSPAHVMAIEALAKWIQPERARELDPLRTLATLNEKFAAVPLEGTYWTSVGPA